MMIPQPMPQYPIFGRPRMKTFSPFPPQFSTSSQNAMMKSFAKQIDNKVEEIMHNKDFNNGCFIKDDFTDSGFTKGDFGKAGFTKGDFTQGSFAEGNFTQGGLTEGDRTEAAPWERCHDDEGDFTEDSSSEAATWERCASEDDACEDDACEANSDKDDSGVQEQDYGSSTCSSSLEK